MTARRPPPEGYVHDPETVGDLMRNRRLELGLLRRHVARTVGTRVQTIRNWEVNRSSPHLRFMPAVNAFLGYDVYATQEEALGQRIVAWRRARGMSQRELARRLRVDESTLVRWEKGRSRPSRRLWERVVSVIPDLDNDRA